MWWEKHVKNHEQIKRWKTGPISPKPMELKLKVFPNNDEFIAYTRHHIQLYSPPNSLVANKVFKELCLYVANNVNDRIPQSEFMVVLMMLAPTQMDETMIHQIKEIICQMYAFKAYMFLSSFVNSMLTVPLKNKQMLANFHSDLFDLFFNMFMGIDEATYLDDNSEYAVPVLENAYVVSEFVRMADLLKGISRDSLEKFCGIVAARKIRDRFDFDLLCIKMIKLCDPYKMYCNPLEQKYGRMKGYNMANPAKVVDTSGFILCIIGGFDRFDDKIVYQMKIGMMMKNMILLIFAKNTRAPLGKLPKELFRELKTFLI